MKLKSDAHDTFPLLFKCDGVPLEIIMDNSKEQLSSDFRKKIREANWHQNTIKPHSPCSTASEMNICELNHGWYRMMIKTQSPKRLWYHCAELEARICSFTVHYHYLLNGEVPETVMKGKSADISIMCEYEWYEWVIYNDTTWKFPEPKFVLGR